MRRIQVLPTGAKFTIFALDRGNGEDDQDCPFLDFFYGLDQKAQKSLLVLLNHHADYGPIKDETKSRPLGDGIFEFKTRLGQRVLYFYEPGAITLLTDGFKKASKKSTAHELDQAKAMRTQWRSEQA